MMVGVSKASILGALSQALDLVEGQPEGHALRSARIALRIGRILGMNNDELEQLYFASVLKDSGCSNNAVRIQKIFGGDEHLAKKAVKYIDWTSSVESIKFSFQYTEAGKTLGAKLRRMASNLGTPQAVMNEVTEARCTRGAEIARRLGLDYKIADAILFLDEHWDGKGAPYGKKGLEVPLMSRILGFAQTFEVFLIGFGIEPAYEMAVDRKASWFEPAVVDAALSFKTDYDFFNSLENRDVVGAELPWLATTALDTDIDSICEVFAMIVDAKSSFTAEHSTRVTEYAMKLAAYFDFDEERSRTLRRGALLHDIGKLGVPTGILEKPGKLDDEEFGRIKQHPKMSDLILRRIPSFEELAEIGSAHHERLDGRGYWRGLTADQLSLDVRIVTVSDVFDALTAKRPYRDALPLDQVSAIMNKDAGTAFDPSCLEALMYLEGFEEARAA